MLLLLLIWLGVGSALSASSAEDSEDTPSKIAEGFLKSRSAARDISYSSSFGSEDFDSPDIPSDFHQRWGINKTWHAKTPHPLISRRQSFENYGQLRTLSNSDETDSSEDLSISSEHGSTEPAVRSPTTLASNPLPSTKQTNANMHKSPPKSTTMFQNKAPPSLGKQSPTLQETTKVTKATQNTPIPSAVTIKTVKSVPDDVTIKTTPETPTSMLTTTTLSTTSSSHILGYTTTIGQEITTNNFMSTPATAGFITRSWESPFPKMDRSKKRRGMIVLKPPPEDWPEPKVPDGAKPAPAEFGASLPPMGTYIDTRWGRKGKGNAASFASAPYLGHRKIDFVPQNEKPPLSDSSSLSTSIPAFKWRIRGRRDRGGAAGSKQKGGGYLNEMGQQSGFRRELTMRPGFSKYYIAENTTYMVPTVPNGRPYQRSYFNFRMRNPMNVGRAFGPPEPQYRPPPPHFPPNNPYGQPPFPQFSQNPYPPFPPPPPPFRPQHPYGQRPPPPAFGQGIPHPFRRGPPPPYVPPPPPPYDPHSPLPPEDFAPPLGSYPEVIPPPPPPPPSPYPTGAKLPSVRPFLDGIPTISPIDRGPAPWPRRQIPPVYQPSDPEAHSQYRQFQPRAPDFLRQEPRNFSGYKGPRRGRAYEQYGKADLRPRHLKFFDEFAVRGTPPRFPARKGSGFGVEFQTDITVSPDVLGDFFEKRTWPTRSNKYGYEPYRRSDDRKRPYGFGRYAVRRPPVLGDFGDYKPYKRVDDSAFVSYNFSRPTRSYTFPPRLKLAIKNASYYRRPFRRSGFRGYTLPTIPSIGLAAYMAQDHDYHGNLITPKGRIMNLADLKGMFTWAPDVEETTPLEEQMEEERKAMQPRKTAKPKGMTAREAMRAAAREAIREGEMEAWERGTSDIRRRSWRRVGGSGGGLGAFVRRGGARGSGMRPRNFRRAKRSPEEAEWIERQQRLQHRLGASTDFLTGSRTSSSSQTNERPSSRASTTPLRMHRWRSKGRPLRRA